MSDNWYTLPAGNIRIRDRVIRKLFSEIEKSLSRRYGFKPPRTAILEAALENYAKLVRKK